MATKDPWEWLTLVDADGPFLSRAALKSVFPTGLARPFDTIDDVNSTFVYEHTLWSKAWTHRNGQAESSDDFAWRDRWVTTVLRDLLQWGDHFVDDPDPALTVSSPDGDVVIRPWAVLDVGDGPAALVVVVGPTEDLRHTGTDGWAADAIDRTAALLRATHVSVGLVTDGRWWAIVSAASGVTTASGVFDALIWREERDSRDAFFALAGLTSLAGGAPEKRLPKLFEESVASAEAITEALGDQVRRAVELVLQAMSESHLRAVARGEESPLPPDSKEVYEASVSVLMRVIFLLFAEERGLLPQHQMYRESYGVSGVRVELERQAQNTSEEALDHTWETWHRLLAASKAVFSGATFEDTRMPAYGGSLFDPTRFPWLRATDTQGQLAVRVSDRVMLQVLRAVQIARVGGESRQLSFRDLDVEQIGYVYEGLLGYSAEYTTDVVVGLHGKSGYEPEINLSELAALAEGVVNGSEFAKKLVDHLGKTQPNAKPATAKQIEKAFEIDDDERAADARTRLGFVLLGQTDIVDQLASLHALIRNDLRDFPYVVPAGGLVMTESPQRANTGTHYTPRSLAEEVVLHALEPLVYSPGTLDTENKDEWKLKSSTEILNLKVADIAVGSGAFLVAAARYLAERLIEARSKEGLTLDESEDVKRWAIREVVARCLYGADINGMAVEMCKLSLWLVSMDPGKPFSFVDDRVFHGNSLLGVTKVEQLRAQHIDPDPHNLGTVKKRLVQLDVDADLAKAAQLRRELSSGQVDDADRMRSTRAKRKLLQESRAVTAKLRDVADGIIAAGLLEGGKPGRALEARYDDLADALSAAYPPKNGFADRSNLETILEAGLTPSIETGESRWKPLHWVVEAPDVIVDHGGFDAVVGNPPFLGGQKLTGAMGNLARDWLVNILANGARGSADLVAYFFLRASTLSIRNGGFVALLATNTVAQGDTRMVALDPLIKSGKVVYRSIQSAPWPSRAAAVDYAAVWMTSRQLATGVRAIADSVKVGVISSLLEGEGRTVGDPIPLTENRGVAFIGSYLLGKGFVLNPANARQLIDLDPSNAEVVFPYLIGDDVNSRPDSSASRWVINFFDWTEQRARLYSKPFEIVETRVRPERASTPRAARRERWWQYAERAPGMYRAMEHLENVLTITLTSNAIAPQRVSAKQVIDQTAPVFATDDFADLVALSSSMHRMFAVKYGTTFGQGFRYSIRNAFLPFPFPPRTPLLREIGVRFDSQRREVMRRREFGLTALYNLVNDPKVLSDADVDHIRNLHIEIDTAVMEAYGWPDVVLEHGFYVYRQMERFTVSPAARVEVLDRLLEENHRRAALEAQDGGKKGSRKELDLDSDSTPEGAMF